MKELPIRSSSNYIRFRLSELTAILFLISMNLNYLLGLSQLNTSGASVPAEILLAVLGAALAGIHAISISGRKFSLSEFITILLTLLVGLLSFWRSGAFTFLKLILFWLGCRSIEEKKLLKYESISLLISAGIIVASSLLGMTSLRYARNSTLFVFGFKNPNMFPAVITAILFSYCLRREAVLSGKHIFIQIAFVLTLYWMTRSRSATAVLLMFYALLLLCRLPVFRRLAGRIIKAASFAFLFFAAASYYVAKSYNPGSLMWARINQLMSWRPYLWNRYFIAARITFLGNRLNNLGTLDNAYLVLLLQYGVIVFAVYAGMFRSLVKRSRKENSILLGLAILCYEAYFLVEFTPLLVNVNPLLLIAISTFSSWVDGREIGTNGHGTKKKYKGCRPNDQCYCPGI